MDQHILASSIYYIFCLICMSGTCRRRQVTKFVVLHFREFQICFRSKLTAVIIQYSMKIAHIFIYTNVPLKCLPKLECCFAESSLDVGKMTSLCWRMFILENITLVKLTSLWHFVTLILLVELLQVELDTSISFPLSRFSPQASVACFSLFFTPHPPLPSSCWLGGDGCGDMQRFPWFVFQSLAAQIPPSH